MDDTPLQPDPTQTISPEAKPEEGRRGPWTTGRLLTLVIVVLLIGGFGFVWSRASNGDSSGVVQTGKRAPDFTLPGLSNNSIQLADHRGKVVLVNFWATWCPPCQAEMPELEAVYQAHKDADFAIIGVDQAESAQTVRSYLDDHDFNWTFALDQTGETSRKYGVFGIPESFLIDRNGKVSYIWSGKLTRASLEEQLASLGIGR